MSEAAPSSVGVNRGRLMMMSVPQCHIATHMRTHSALFILQLPYELMLHAVHASTGRLPALFVVLFSCVFLDLFFYGSSNSMLKTCLSMHLYT